MVSIAISRTPIKPTITYSSHLISVAIVPIANYIIIIINTCVYVYNGVPMAGLSKRRRDDGTGDGTLAIDCPGKDHRIGTLSKVNNIIYCKNDVLAE